MNQQNEVKKASKSITITFSIIIIIALVLFVKTIANNMSPVDVVLDAKALYTDISSLVTVTQEELISMIGEPEKTEVWTYTNSSEKNFEITSLYYENSTYEYNFYENHLQRISIDKDIPLVNKNRNLELFNLSKTDYTTLKDTGSALRYYNCGINDLWFWNIENNTASGVKISYTSLFE